MNAKVSIITPSFNAAKYIAETIQSVQRQTHSNWEMIIVDDCSTDNTAEIVQSFSEQDTRIRFFKLESNSGAGIARNYALQQAQGEYIAFLDSDDLWKPYKLQKQLDFMEQNNVPLTFSFYDQIDESGESMQKRITTPKVITYKNLFYCNWIGNLTGIYAVKYFGKVPISDFKKRQDWILWLTLVKKAGKAIPVQESLAFYRVRPNSISASKINLLKHNYSVYRNFHKQNRLMAIFSMIRFLYNQLIVKPTFCKTIN